MTELEPTIAWRHPAPERRLLDTRIVPMLRAVEAGGTLADAARAAGIGYRSAWGLIADVERELGAPVLDLARGRGARLAPLGARLLEHDRAAQAWLERRRDALTLTLTKPGAGMLAVSASHDLALAALRESWRDAGVAEISFKGSADALADYLRGDVALAGFHYIAGDDAGSESLLRRLDASREVTLRFLTRTQGLMLPRGNPRRVRSLADVARKGIAFVNRQRGSGTRMIVDALLAGEGIDPSSIRGYGDEEFTHAAVAATIASGRADAGFGVAAAADRHGLAFVALARERYRFACRRDAVESGAVAAFRSTLASRATRNVVTGLPGYALDRPGTVASLARGYRRRP